MQRHFHEQLDALKQTLLAMGGLVEDQIRRVMRALVDRDGALAQEVIDRDRQVNAYDLEVDEKCVELLALHQPTAKDLRFITTAMKIVTDLERMGDQAVNIAQRAIELNREPQLKPYVDLPRMAEKAQRMVKESLDAFVSRDTELARRVCAEAADADALKELYARGVTDGLPVVPPTRARVARAIAASGRGPDELVGLVPPNYGRATVEKVAVNAVMAGCRPEYLPVVIAAVEAV